MQTKLSAADRLKVCGTQKKSKLKNRSGIESKLRENRVVLVAMVQKTIEIYKNFESFTVKWHTEAKKCEFNYGVIS